MPQPPPNSEQRASKSVQNRLDPATLMRIKNLEWRAKAVVEGFLTGLHRSPYHGYSAEFSEYRQYTPGDDPRYLDWRLFGRSDRYFIKRFEEETNLACWILLDLSRSMGFGSVEYSKVDYARTVAASLAYFLNRQRDAVGLVTFDERIQESLPARFRPSHLRRIMVSIERSVGGEGTDLSTPLEQIAVTVSQRGLIVLISDLLTPVEEFHRRLGFLRARGHEVVVVRILDPREIDFDFDSPAMFRDSESGQEIFIDPEDAKRSYRERFQEHSAAVEEAAAQLGADVITAVTDQPIDDLLFDFLASRSRDRGGRTQRRSQTGAG